MRRENDTLRRDLQYRERRLDEIVLHARVWTETPSRGRRSRDRRRRHRAGQARSASRIPSIQVRRPTCILRVAIKELVRLARVGRGRRRPAVNRAVRGQGNTKRSGALERRKREREPLERRVLAAKVDRLPRLAPDKREEVARIRLEVRVQQVQRRVVARAPDLEMRLQGR